MPRPTFNSVFEENESTIRDRMLDSIDDDWRKDPGDFVYDVIAPSPLEIKQLQINQDQVLKSAFAQYAEGEWLDYLLNDIGLTRKNATPNQRTLNIKAAAGVVIPEGHTLNTVVLDDNGDPLEYTVDETVKYDTETTKAVKVTCSTAGTIGNIAVGSEFIFQPSIAGIKSIVDQGTDILGTDKETDEEAYERYKFKVTHPDTGGNKNDYVRWLQELSGIGDQKIIPLWNGNGTVKVVLLDTNYQPASAALVKEVQEYLDPLLDKDLEAENMEASGYGVTINTDNVTLTYDSQGNGILSYGYLGVLETLLRSQNHFKARVRVKVDSTAGTNDLLKIEVRYRGSKIPLYETNDEEETNQATVTLTASDLSTSYTYVEVPFYWNGRDEIEIAIERLTTDTTTTVTVDMVNFVSIYGMALGEGKAPAGARVYVTPATDLPINITATITLETNYTVAEVQNTFEEAVKEYLQEIAFKEPPENKVLYNKIGSLLINTKGVSNYSDLTVNGGTSDIEPGEEEVATLGTVTFR